MRARSVKYCTIAVLAFVLTGCADSKDPIGGDTGIACFNLVAEPPEFSNNGNALMKLVPVFPNEFNQLDGMWVVFSSSSDSGVFTPESNIIVQVGTQTNLNPETWFRYDGSQTNFDIVLKAEVYSQSSPLVWDTCTVRILP